MIRIPYGVAHFPSIRDRGQVFIDRTAYIRALEEVAEHLVFLRPRRFGKSLWLSILEHYYDVRFAADFDRFFGGLDIGREPTELHHSQLTLRLDFSGVDASGDEAHLRRSFTTSLKTAFLGFLNSHRAWLPDAERTIEQLATVDHPEAALGITLDRVRSSGRQVYLLIDEYDNFANELIATRQEERYELMVRGTGFLKNFFKLIKHWAGLGVIARSFITGVTPLVFDDMTSGFNIATHLSTERAFAGMLGFTHEDVDRLIGQTMAELDEQGQAGSLPPAAEITELLRAWYDGYRFHRHAPTLFNPDMVLYFLQSLVRGYFPEELLDLNLRPDLTKLELVLRTAGDVPRFFTLVEAGGRVEVKPHSSFGLKGLGDQTNFFSLLYYLGMLTLEAGERPAMCIPNYVIRTLVWEELRQLLTVRLELGGTEPVRSAISRMMDLGEGESFFRLLLEQVIVRASQRDFIHFNEAAFKAVALAFLSLSSEVSVFSEWETGRGYADLVLVPAVTATYLRHAWLIELKYLKQKDDSPAARESKLTEARAELTRYLADEARMRYLRRFELHHATALLIDGGELVWDEPELGGV